MRISRRDGIKQREIVTIFCDFRNFWVDLKVKADENKLNKWYTHFEKDYPEVFAVEIEVNKAAVQQQNKEEKLENVEEILLQNKSRERFTNYDNIRADPNLTVADKIIAYQKAIDDTTRRKIHFASLQGELLSDVLRNLKRNTRSYNYYEMRRLESDGLNFSGSYASLLSITPS